MWRQDTYQEDIVGWLLVWPSATSTEAERVYPAATNLAMVWTIRKLVNGYAIDIVMLV
ncbi:hypothetical protein HRbin02_00052 [Candidatus Calditenuaceae archaeon HR02]|nr:hypothetical protein HRbin02_00052 [Candidatus Calditenuaceae archaeon HR02]